MPWRAPDHRAPPHIPLPLPNHCIPPALAGEGRVGGAPQLLRDRLPRSCPKPQLPLRRALRPQSAGLAPRLQSTPALVLAAFSSPIYLPEIGNTRRFSSAWPLTLGGAPTQ